MNPDTARISDKLLFTPGPLTTSAGVKQAMLRDVGSRDTLFIETVRRVRARLLALADVSQEAGYECVLMQGSGTFTVEAVISSSIPPAGKLLVIENGAYGKRIAMIAERHGIDVVTIHSEENQLPDLTAIERALAADTSIAMVAVVHCETTSGIMNPIAEIGRIVKQHPAAYFVDSMSAFGGVEFDFPGCQIDYLVSSANKCIEGVPGFGFAICRRDTLLASEGWARTVSLDLVAQWKGLEKDGQFRFTPPTHTILAFDQALSELEAEGGVAGRSRRYRENHQVLLASMRKMGFEEYVDEQLQGHIITSFYYPPHAAFDFAAFYDRLSEHGHLIYPGKVTSGACFRIGNIGRLTPDDMRALLGSIEQTMKEFEIPLPLESACAAIA